MSIYITSAKRVCMILKRLLYISRNI